MQWHPHDQDAEFALLGYNAERCPECHIHDSVWRKEKGGHPNAVQPTWVFCRVCQQIAQAHASGPPGVEDKNNAPGWRLELQRNESL